MTAKPTSKTDSQEHDREDAAERRPLVIVESPAKARTIAQFLGPEYTVESSIGHIRDLPSKAAEIPKRIKKEPWARLGVNVDGDFKPEYVIPDAKKQHVAKLRKLLKGATELYLATDEDREGEAIAWHLVEVLKPKVPVRRMVFHEITRSAIQEAMANPREIDECLVQAQEARRILDRLYGYEVSPVLWRKVKPRLSAGRVQSAAVRLIVTRERLRMQFVAASFWDVEASAAVRDGARETISARMVELDGQRLAAGRDFDAESGQLRDSSGLRLLDEATAVSVAGSLEHATYTVTSVQQRPYTQRPPAPFITSTLQQEAGRKLRYSAQRTMQAAQQLYENGYITYMRTDSTELSTEALRAARSQVADLYGKEYVPDSPRRYQTSARKAQEAHEAIRPAGSSFRTPEQVRGEVGDDGFRLYDLIWKRTMASQMRDATGQRTNVRLEATAADHGVAAFALSGKVITFPGFLRAYVEGSDNPDAELEDQERLLPPLREGQELDGAAAEARGHETQPPNRYTEASLVRELEELGIGRPSTYASIIQTVQDRGYIWKKSTSLIPTFTAFAVVNLLEQHFPELIDLGFTARMEDELDAIAAGDVEATPWLRNFYFGDPDGGHPAHTLAADGLKERIGSGWEEIDARSVSSVPLGIDEQGREIAVRVGRYGAYVQAGDEPVRANLPEDQTPDELSLEKALALLKQAAMGDQELTRDAESGRAVYLRSGRFGPYVQLGEDDENDGKPPRASLWPNMSMETLTPEQALLLLSFPRTLGTHPDTKEPVTAQDGPNGPYLRAGDETRSLEDHDQLASVTLDEALKLFAQPKQRRRQGASVIAELGPHPESAAPLSLRNGRFGPYVTDGVVNASLPRGRDPRSITIEQAVDLIAAREERMRAEGKDPRAKKAPRPRPRKKSA